jgi:small subunit ribosomal protein S3
LGHKVNPTGFRLGVIKGWESRWFAGRNYKDLVIEDDKLRKLIQRRLANASVARIEIERLAGTQISVAIHTAKPGIVIGKSGENVERLRQSLEQATKKKVRLSILEIRNPEVNATLIARSIAEQLEKRVSFRRAMKQAVQKAMRAGAKGIKVIIGGRLGGAEIARSEKEVEGSVPLQTLRADIDYGLAEAHTTFGVIGIKVWVYHGDVLPERQRAEGLGAAQLAATPVPAIGERGPERGPRGERGSRGGERGGRGGRVAGERPPRTATGAGVGERSPRAPSGERGTRAGGTTGTGSERRGGRSGPAQSGSPAGTPRQQRPEPRPSGTVEPTEGETLPSSGPVSAAPAAHEFPAPAASEAASATEVELEPRPAPEAPKSGKSESGKSESGESGESGEPDNSGA